MDTDEVPYTPTQSQGRLRTGDTLYPLTALATDEARELSLTELPTSKRTKQIEAFFSVLPTAEELANEDNT